MKTSKEILEEHYKNKYKDQSISVMEPVFISNFPKNRFEAAVKNIGEGENYLEIAPGDGRVLYSVRKNFTNLVGIEISTSRVEHLKSIFKNDSRVTISHGNIEDKNLTYEKNTFDWIVLVALIEHLVEPISCLEYLYGLLKPGGKILIDTPNIAKWTRRIKLMAGRFPSTASLDEGLLMYDKKTKTDLYDEGHLHYFTYRSLSRILKERIGFKDVQWNGYGDWYLLSSAFPTIFSEIQIIAKK